MKFKTFMPVLALACVCAVGQADAAQDRLMMPEQPAEPLNVIEAEVAVPVPSEEVRDVVNAFTQFQLDQKGKRIMDDSRVMTGAKLDYAQQIIDILDRNTANVHDDELRFYMNEMVIFSLNEAMKDGNNRVKPVDEKAAPAMDELHTVDLRKAINAPTIQ
ncbi:hypothetical protein [Veillonella parvula]|uniref:hypothetical protein n=1 Tax=Veillonella parvula TaxID=29466 RepID=UPI002907FF6D|nr:hypothetical protein [Veillonella parvula]MDU6948891.1 hypothetical protein [Veillonella parvula]